MNTDVTWQRYQMQAQVISALAHPVRVAIADLLKDGEVCVCEIAQRIGAERSNTSRHLAIMLKAGVVRTRKDGLQVFYSLRTPCVANFLNCATQTIQQTLKEQTKALASA
ncbi:MAG: metalloregulator ArsR/SmtB family transcription factor [Phycisphaeraceae bacterium]